MTIYLDIEILDWFQDPEIARLPRWRQHAALDAAFVREFGELAARVERFTLSIRPVDAWILLSQLQLALRHPQNTGPTAEAAKQIAHRLQSIVAPHGALAAVAERGWDASYDVPEASEEHEDDQP